jgi:hypothetical protein
VASESQAPAKGELDVAEPDPVAAVPEAVVCTENLIRVDDVMESPKLAQ